MGAYKGLKGLLWTGSKSAWGVGTGRWISRQLPVRPVYIEPFAGMLGVLLQRPKVRREMASDVDRRVINWWRVVRDDKDSLQWLLDDTPNWSAQMFAWAWDAENEPEVQEDSLHAAYWFTLRMSLAFGSKPVLGRNDVRRSYSEEPAGGFHTLDLTGLQKRIKRVELETKDALWMLDRYGHIEEAVIYCDPPYLTASPVHKYQIEDVGAMVDVLRKCKAFVAISGYGDDWDMLDWERHEKWVPNTLNAGSYSNPRHEVLWTNQHIVKQGTLL